MVSTVAYGKPEELRVRVGGSITTDDPTIQALLSAVSRMWDNFCNRHEYGFKAIGTAAARVYGGTGKAYLNIDECIEITQVAVKDSVTETTFTAWASTDWIGYRGSYRKPNFNDLPITSIMVAASGTKSYFLDGRYAAQPGFTVLTDADLNRRVPTVEITARWGYADDTPEIIKEATIAQAAIFYKRGRGSWSDVLRNPDFGDERFVRVLDPALQFMVQSTRLVRRTDLN